MTKNSGNKDLTESRGRNPSLLDEKQVLVLNSCTATSPEGGDWRGVPACVHTSTCG